MHSLPSRGDRLAPGRRRWGRRRWFCDARRWRRTPGRVRLLAGHPRDDPNAVIDDGPGRPQEHDGLLTVNATVLHELAKRQDGIDRRDSELLRPPLGQDRVPKLLD